MLVCCQSCNQTLELREVWITVLLCPVLIRPLPAQCLLHRRPEAGGRDAPKVVSFAISRIRPTPSWQPCSTFGVRADRLPVLARPLPQLTVEQPLVGRLLAWALRNHP